jgi:hypothetical protein
MNYRNKLYKGEINLEFDANRHRYTYNGEVVPSVTSLLSIINKPALVNWAANTAVECIQGSINPGVSYDEIQLHTIFEAGRKAHFQKKVDAGNIGSLVHKWIEQYIKNENPATPINEGLRESIDHFMKWVVKYDVKFLLAEQVVYSKRYKFAGMLDFICTIEGKMYIGDTKTSSGIYNEYFLQTAAYRYARHEEFPEEKYAGQLIIRIGKDGEFEFAVVRDTKTYQDMFRAFLSAQNLSQTLDYLKEWKADKE